MVNFCSLIQRGRASLFLPLEVLLHIDGNKKHGDERDLCAVDVTVYLKTSLSLQTLGANSWRWFANSGRHSWVCKPSPRVCKPKEAEERHVRTDQQTNNHGRGCCFGPRPPFPLFFVVVVVVVFDYIMTSSEVSARRTHIIV